MSYIQKNYLLQHVNQMAKGGGTGGARGAIAPHFSLII